MIPKAPAPPPAGVKKIPPPAAATEAPKIPPTLKPADEVPAKDGEPAKDLLGNEVKPLPTKFPPIGTELKTAKKALPPKQDRIEEQPTAETLEARNNPPGIRLSKAVQEKRALAQKAADEAAGVSGK